MRIVYLTQSYPPMISGASIFAQAMAEAMAQCGHQILVIAASDREYPYQIDKANISILRLSSLNNPLRVSQRLLLNPRRKIMKALNQFQPDVIHAHEPLQMGTLALDYAKRMGIPVTLTAHQLPWFATSYLAKPLRPVVEKMLWIYVKSLVQKYTSLISPTQTIATIIEETIGLKAKVISYGLDLQTFHPPHSSDTGTVWRTRLNLPSNIPLLLHVGRVDSDKNVDKVIRASAPVVRESEAHLVIVGDGCQKNRLMQLCREMRIERQVHFSGYMYHEDLPQIYRTANIFITASEIETQGIVLLEAAASGLPIVAVNATCIPEIVHHQVNGFLIEPGNVEAFSQAIIKLLRNPSKSRFMGRQGRILAEQHDVQHTWTLHENLYQEMIKQTSQEHAEPNGSLFNSWKAMKNWMGLN